MDLVRLDQQVQQLKNRPVGSTHLKASEVAPEAGTDDAVLLVEPDEDIRFLFRETLQNGGYRVLEARDGLEGLKKAKESLAQITLILTDLVMPKMSGLELARALRADRPQLPVLFISGHTPDPDVRDRALDPDLDYIDQPLSAERILLRVRKSLEQTEGRHRG